MAEWSAKFTGGFAAVLTGSGTLLVVGTPRRGQGANGPAHEMVLTVPAAAVQQAHTTLPSVGSRAAKRLFVLRGDAAVLPDGRVPAPGRIGQPTGNGHDTLEHVYDISHWVPQHAVPPTRQDWLTALGARVSLTAGQLTIDPPTFDVPYDIIDPAGQRIDARPLSNVFSFRPYEPATLLDVVTPDGCVRLNPCALAFTAECGCGEVEPDPGEPLEGIDLFWQLYDPPGAPTVRVQPRWPDRDSGLQVMKTIVAGGRLNPGPDCPMAFFTV